MVSYLPRRIIRSFMRLPDPLINLLSLSEIILCVSFLYLTLSGEAGNTTVIGTQLYFTSVRQRYKHGGQIERAFWRKRKTCLLLSRVAL